MLELDVSSFGATLGDILRKTEAVLAAERPDTFLVLGDTSSALSLIMAKRMPIPTYHMEAGNRCFDANVPEETTAASWTEMLDEVRRRAAADDRSVSSWVRRAIEHELSRPV